MVVAIATVVIVVVKLVMVLVVVDSSPPELTWPFDIHLKGNSSRPSKGISINCYWSSSVWSPHAAIEVFLVSIFLTPPSSGPTEPGLPYHFTGYHIEASSPPLDWEFPRHIPIYVFHTQQGFPESSSPNACVSLTWSWHELWCWLPAGDTVHCHSEGCHHSTRPPQRLAWPRPGGAGADPPCLPPPDLWAPPGMVWSQVRLSSGRRVIP